MFLTMCSKGWHISLKNIGKIMVSIKQKTQKGNAKIAVHDHKNPVCDKTAARMSKASYVLLSTIDGINF
ncbi:hypothetical protein DCC62_24655 [candidate division KSB1 bacterium]|nr:MAG: hypothetical protein DCC62_24655 [candidate division KSB1 bacterium]